MIHSEVVERRIRLAAIVLLIGFVVEALTLQVLHPLAFILFLVTGALLIVFGITLFLRSLLRLGEKGGAEAGGP